MSGAGTPVASYVGLPPVNATAAADTTGNNAGKYTASIDSNLSITQITQFELYKITLDGPVGFDVRVFFDNKKWSHTSQGWQNEWDPSQPGLLTSGQIIYFYFGATTGLLPVPTVTCWFRYDASLPALQGSRGL